MHVYYMRVYVCVWVCLVILGLIIGYSLLYSALVSRAQGLVTGMLNNNALRTTNYRIHCIVLIYEIFNIRIVQLSYLRRRTGGNSIQFRFRGYSVRMLFTILIQPSKCFREGIRRNEMCGPSGVRKFVRGFSKEDHSIYLMGVWLHIVVYKALLASFAYTFYCFVNK